MRSAPAPQRAHSSAALPLWLAALLAACAPTLLAYNAPPSATLLNQCVAVAAWGVWLLALAPSRRPHGSGVLLGALGLMAAAALASWLFGALPRSLSLAAIGLLGAAALMVGAGAEAARRIARVAVFEAFCVGLLVAGVASALVALLQVFAPDLTDGSLIATSGLPGRAVGNLRQPNHLCSLLLWAVVAAVALHELGRLPRAAMAGLVALLVLGVELSASRTGAVGLGVLMLWGLMDRRLSPASRWLLLATPLLYGLAYLAMGWYGELAHQALGAEARLDAGGLGDGGSRNGRSNIWRNAWALVMAHPWRGVGFGEFNFAWTLSPFAGRPTAFFDHTHNLPLQLAVELGLPLAALVLALLGWALWQGASRALQAPAEAGSAGRAALVLVLLAALHSMVEYPLWYAYFLLPTAFAWGWMLGLAEPAPASAEPGLEASPAGPWAATLGLALGLMMSFGGALAVLDYRRVVVIYAPPVGSSSLAERIAQGQRSLLFAHHADYAAATNEAPAASRELGFARGTHSLLDTRLMSAWAQHLHAQGHDTLARGVAARLREFDNPESDEFFAACAGQPQAPAFPCLAPAPAPGWHDYAAAARPARR
ncbi:PglL family O-oligosaccharyltransferase [Aquabacterium sp. OR-4]|uniref:PglL family O-oligosaccharyltransferase n=1 Tax=Aquabacterium sp. OR-4 TaxID=2978127 RepID=UPI0021B19A43|nr:O-antigen ligase family protein [Aquabacterium sp. OR-4]MDT7833920.1 Wzy polymerase domain-containing protein [Aquabacterium sp. OR-4]